MLDEQTKRKIFWLLKRYSSLTLWQHAHEVYQPLYNAVEQMVTHHPEDNPDWQQLELYKRCLDDQVNYKRGLTLLASGNRSVFRLHTEGYLTDTSSGTRYITALLHRGDCPHDWAYLGDLARRVQAAREGGGGSFESEEGEPAAWYATWILLPQNLPKHSFPDPLPPLPESPEPPVLIKTSERIPVDGIYEPEGDGTCMNYLLCGTTAPFVTSDLIRDDIPTTWRLIWEDHRYEDGTIPEEEKDYFLPLPAKSVERASERSEPFTEKLRALPGEACIRDGYWWTLAKEGSRRYFKRGEVFPDFPSSQFGQTIWYFDREQGV